MIAHTRSVSLVAILLLSLASPALISDSSSEAQSVSDIEILHTAVNPSNNKTYHLLSEGTWSESALVARALDGFLTHNR